ncbi:thiamine kinase-like enzyme [Neorhizobium galegae]|uniref:phosphotransferase family protein n=1 Tax=Neorhizobium galegae TaxID=399 RepID=UPI001AE52E6C|nr:phosphotransferase [Neorhizobium galegae]MBP2548562.1 thiamine kinase-like enzyme [Neorhizobium galegae]
MKTPGSPESPLESRAEAALAAFSEIVGSTPRYAPLVPAVASPSYHAVESASFAVSPAEGAPSFFLRLGLDEVADLVDDAAAFAAAIRFHHLGLSPQPLVRDVETRSVLFARLDEGWRAARIDDLIRTERVSRLIEIQKEIAAGALLGRSWSVFDGITELWTIAVRDGGDLPGDTDWMLSWTETIREAVTASGIDIRPAHGDPHASNVMLGSNGALCLVDFDMAGDMDPYYQLGVQMNELYQFESQMKPLLEMHDGSFSDKAFNRCRVYAAADDFYWALRSLVLELRSPPRGIEFLKYANWRFLRCRMLLGHPDFEARLRAL